MCKFTLLTLTLDHQCVCYVEQTPILFTVCPYVRQISAHSHLLGAHGIMVAITEKLAEYQ